MDLLGIKFAPLNVPLERRLQTLAAAAWFITFALGGIICSTLAVYLFFFTRLNWLVLIYLLWWYYDRDTKNKGGRM